MPVIGRLDKQVEEVLITPLEKRRESEDGPLPAEKPAPRPPEIDTTDAPPGDERRRPEGELPVWLL